MQKNNGAEWTLKQYRELVKKRKPFESLQLLTSKIYAHQNSEKSIYDWPVDDDFKDLVPDEELTVRHKMDKNTFTVDVNDSVELVFNIMIWKDIHHVPVINNKKKLVGLLTWRDIGRYKDDKAVLMSSVKSIMIKKKDIITISQDEKLDTARKIMENLNIHGIPVTENNQLIGIITLKDLQ